MIPYRHRRSLLRHHLGHVTQPRRAGKRSMQSLVSEGVEGLLANSYQEFDGRHRVLYVSVRKSSVGIEV